MAPPPRLAGGFIDPNVANDPCAAANAPVPGGFAGFLAVRRLIDNAGINNYLIGSYSPIYPVLLAGIS